MTSVALILHSGAHATLLFLAANIHRYLPRTDRWRPAAIARDIFIVWYWCHMDRGDLSCGIRQISRWISPALAAPANTVHCVIMTRQGCAWTPSRQLPSSFPDRNATQNILNSSTFGWTTLKHCSVFVEINTSPLSHERPWLYLSTLLLSAQWSVRSGSDVTNADVTNASQRPIGCQLVGCSIKLMDHSSCAEYIASPTSTGNAREPALCQLYRHTFILYTARRRRNITQWQSCSVT